MVSSCHPPMKTTPREGEKKEMAPLSTMALRGLARPCPALPGLARPCPALSKVQWHQETIFSTAKVGLCSLFCSKWKAKMPDGTERKKTLVLLRLQMLWMPFTLPQFCSTYTYMDGWMDGWMGGWMDRWIDDVQGVLARLDSFEHTAVGSSLFFS